MDAPGRLNDDAADKALRDLFLETGPLQASNELDARILEAIRPSVLQAPVQERSLVPRWLLITGAVALLVLVLLLPAGPDGASRWSEWIPSFSFSGVLGSRWMVMALITGAVLFALETWLDARPFATKRH